jgi:hypothetical protein
VAKHGLIPWLASADTSFLTILLMCWDTSNPSINLAKHFRKSRGHFFALLSITYFSFESN